LDIPKVIQLQQFYHHPEIQDIRFELLKNINQFNLGSRIHPGDKIAITAGSRGIKDMVPIIKYLIIEIKKWGGHPFIVPAMGSHGGGTARGQAEILKSLGITEEHLLAPIKSSMKVVRIGETEHNTPVYLDRYAYQADGIIVINRIKKHTDYDNKTESGLLKIMTVGLGKQKQAEIIHSYGVWGLKNLIPASAKVVLTTKKIITGIAIIENARGNTAHLELIDPIDIPEREKRLYELAEKYYPWLPFRICDVLVIKNIGKNISGTCMDTNLIGRKGVWGESDPEKMYATGNKYFGQPLIEYVVALNLTKESHGNAIGIGQADIITSKLFNKINLKVTYNNVITTTFLDKGKIPLIAENDFKAMMIALNSLNGLMRIEGKKNSENVKLCIIDSTSHKGEMQVSEGLYKELQDRKDIEFRGDFLNVRFDKKGNLI
jgi:hypothetical protein